MSADLTELEKRMHSAMDALKKEFGGLRTGRASVNLLDPVMVEAYGQRMPLNQVGTVSAPEPRLLTVSVWDKGLVTPTAKAIREAGLGLNPSPDGQMVRIPVQGIREAGRNTMGVKLINLDGKDKLQAIAPVISEKEEDGAIGDPAAPVAPVE